MKHSIVLKFLAIALASLSLVAAVGGAAGIVAMESSNLYVTGLEFLQDQEYESIAKDIATAYAETYAAETLGELPYTLRGDQYQDPADRADAEHWYVSLSLDGKLQASEGKKTGNPAFTKELQIAPLYAIASLLSPEDMAADSTQPTTGTEAMEPGDKKEQSGERGSVFPETTVPEDYLYYSEVTTWQNGSLLTYYLYYYQAPEYTVAVQLREKVLENSALHLLTTLYPHRYTFIAVLALGLLLAAICTVYLLVAAGHCADGSIRPGALNRLPLDLYALLAGFAVAALAVLFFRLCEWTDREGPHLGNLSLLGINLLGICLIVYAFVFAFAAQIKVKNAFWWRNSIIGWLCRQVAALVRWIHRAISALMMMLPIIWQWLVIVAVLAVVGFVTFLLATSGSYYRVNGLFILLLIEIFVCLGVVCYAGYCFGVLLKGARQMSQGDLGCKVPTKYLRGSFLRFADQLNALSETALIAAQKQMQSERMKSELITNVSHDIKTPLTSIINFVDLLQKPHSQEQEQEYLEVLARQSDRMKKLIEDLMELSKASSGNISVNLQEMDAAESVNQALGEFSDKLENAGLCPIFHSPRETIRMIADGRLVWRVLSNLLGNAVKYALPGTRLYIDLVKVDGQVLLSLKNISRAPLNIPAEELMERFVRGDAARKGEGSGLGLNIAKNLMEVQGGQLQLLLDGDLFKVTLIFPSAE